MTRQGAAWLAGVALIVGGTSSCSGAAERPVMRDAARYALASCLTRQPNAYLRDQGFGLGAIVANRAGWSPDLFAGVRAAVAAEMKRRPMTTIHGDGPVGSEKALPVAYCLDVTEAPTVRAAVARVAARWRR